MPDIRRSASRRRISRTALRLIGVFSVILIFFAASLLVTLFTLQQIVTMESEIAEIDKAKHAGHLAATYVREQYIHQAHTIISWNLSHLDHYDQAVNATREQTAELQRLALTPEERACVDEVTHTATLNDELFRNEVIPAIQRNEPSQKQALNERLETHVNQVVRLNEKLNGMLERRSRDLLERAEFMREQVRVVILCCFGLAIAVSFVLGLTMTRSILRPLSALRAGVLRLAGGDLSTRIALDGRDEFGELASSFNQMAADLARHQEHLVRSQKLASIGQMAAGVAHEINNPLGVILGYIKLMLKEPAQVKISYLTTVEDEVRQCQRIVQDLLDLARPPRLEPARIDLAELAREAIERLGESGKLRALRIEQPASDVHVTVYGDEAKLRQVVFNIVLNAVEAMPSGGALTIRVAQKGDEAVLHVADTGSGIPPEVLPHVFDPFFSTKPKGTGLGLVISQAIVDAHGGAIDLRSEAGKGTRVAVRLPAKPPVGSAVPRTSSSGRKSNRRSGESGE